MSKFINSVFDPLAQVIVENYHVMRLNFWDGNFWDKPRAYPYPIFGRRGLPGEYTIYNILFLPTFIKFDWNPAQEPYDIGV